MPERFARSAGFERRVEAYLRRRADIVIHSGVEHVIPDYHARAVLRQVDSPAARQWRFTPDYLVVQSGWLWYAECKVGLAVEREVFEHYLTIDSETPTWLFFLTPEGTVYKQRVSRIGFVDSQAYVSQFREPFAVDSDSGWILPPPGDKSGYSREPFRVADTESLIEVEL